MTLYMNNKGGMDILNNWSTSSQTRAVSIRFAFVQELKEQGVLEIKWIKSEDNCADLFTKNLGTKMYQKHGNVFKSLQDLQIYLFLLFGKFTL